MKLICTTMNVKANHIFTSPHTPVSVRTRFGLEAKGNSENLCCTCVLIRNLYFIYFHFNLLERELEYIKKLGIPSYDETYEFDKWIHWSIRSLWSTMFTVLIVILRVVAYFVYSQLCHVCISEATRSLKSNPAYMTIKPQFFKFQPVTSRDMTNGIFLLRCWYIKLLS